MIRKTYKQDRTQDKTEPIVTIEGLDIWDDIFDNVFEKVSLYIPLESQTSLTNYKTSHRIQWSDTIEERRGHIPAEIRFPNRCNAYVMSNEVSNLFNDKLNSVSIIASPDIGSRIIFSYETSNASADVVECDENDGSDKTLQKLILQGVRGNYVADWFNPFKIRRLDNLQMVVEKYTCEVNLNGLLFGQDAELLIEQRLATRNDRGLVLLNQKYLASVVDMIITSRRAPGYFEFGEKKHATLTPEFYHTMHRKLDQIFRQVK